MRNEHAVQLPAGRWALAPVVALGALGSVTTIIQMALLSEVVGRVLLDHQHLRPVLPRLLLLLGVIGLRALLAWREEVGAQRAALHLTGSLRNRLMTHLLQLGPAYMQQERSGEVATTAIEGVDRLTLYYQRYLPLQSLSMIVPALVVLFLFKIDPLGALLLLGTAPLIPLLMVLVGSYAQSHVERHWLALSRLGAQFLDTLQGLPTLLLFGRADAAGEQVRAASEAFQERTLNVLRVAFLSGMVLDIMTGMAIGLVAVLVAVQLLAGSLPFQSALLVLLLAPECYRPLRELGAQRHAAMEGKAAGQRILAILETPVPLPVTPYDACAGDRLSCANPAENSLRRPLTVVFSGVTYRYQNRPGVAEATSTSSHPAVDGVTLTLAAGTRTALVGRSGAGKSTLANLLLRFLDPDEGTITVNGAGLAGLPLQRWRAQVALVPQQPHLFAGSVADNLRLARPDATSADLEWAAEQAGAAEFIARLPGGYAAPVGEQGALLSTGQVQRLAIARAFLKDAPLLILDEPTSALDPEHESRIRHSLEGLMARRTVLIAAHRLNTISSADQIAMLEGGRLVECGSHGQLLERSAAYARLMGRGRRPHPPVRDRQGATAPPPGQATGGPLAPDCRGTGTVVAFPAPSPSRKGWWGFGRFSAPALLGVLTHIAGIGLLATGGYLTAAAALSTPMLALGLPIALVRLFGVGRGVARYAERLSSHRVTFALLTELRVWCYRRLAPLAPARLGSYRSGDLLTRLVKDVDDVQTIYLRVCAPIVVAVVVGALIVLLFAHFSPALAGIMLAFMVLAGVGVPWLVYHLSCAAQEQVVAGRAALQAQLVDVLHGMADLLASGQAAARHGGLSSGHALLTRSRQRLARVAGLQRLLATLLAGMAMWTVLFLTIRLSDEGALNPLYLPLPALVALVAFEAVQPLGEAFAVYRGATASAERVHALIDAMPAVSDPPHPRPAPARFDLCFERLTFAYQPEAPAVVRDISFRVPQGSRVAIVGPSGCGKTTLVNLLVRFWDPDSGAIRLGGHDLREYRLDDLRRSIGVVGQRTTIFNDTLRRNLLLARPQASDDELLWALERAQLGELVAHSPLGLDRWVGEQGVQLSGGERQRLAIARTLLLDAPALILDEPTANLDPRTEGELLAELIGVMAGRTTLYITHRLIGLEQMDEILVLDGGRIVERGTHCRLATTGGLYRRMLDAQEQFVGAV